MVCVCMCTGCSVCVCAVSVYVVDSVCVYGVLKVSVYVCVVSGRTVRYRSQVGGVERV